MRRKRIIGQIMMFSLVIGLTGCNQSQSKKAVEEEVILSSGDSEDTEDNNDSDYMPGLGFRPPKASRRDKNGNIVDPEGNTFNNEGKWQVPEGGRVDSQGRIYDKNGKIMGGGAVVGSQG